LSRTERWENARAEDGTEAQETPMARSNMINISSVDHIGIRVTDLDRAMRFYGALGFELHWKDANDAVAVAKNANDVEINLVYNANADAGGKNILMDVGEKYPGYTHIALRVESIKATIETLREHGIRITQGPVSFGRDGHVSVFVRDPDLNVVELRGREEDLSSLGGVTAYQPQN
jgi:lactoylglutathione lyase